VIAGASLSAVRRFLAGETRRSLLPRRDGAMQRCRKELVKFGSRRRRRGQALAGVTCRRRQKKYRRGVDMVTFDGHLA